MFNMFEIPAIKHVFEFILSNLTSLWKDDLVAQLAKALYQYPEVGSSNPAKSFHFFQAFLTKWREFQTSLTLWRDRFIKELLKLN